MVLLLGNGWVEGVDGNLVYASFAGGAAEAWFRDWLEAFGPDVVHIWGIKPPTRSTPSVPPTRLGWATRRRPRFRDSFRYVAAAITLRARLSALCASRASVILRGGLHLSASGAGLSRGVKPSVCACASSNTS